MEINKFTDHKVDIAFRSIKASFEAGEIEKMSDIAPLYPTKIIRALGLNHERYICKLEKPEEFSIIELIRFSRLIGVDHHKVFEVILVDAIPNVLAREKLKKIKSEA